MRYDVYFHNDFDGYASAAVFLAYLKSRGDTARFFPIDHDIRPRWLTIKFQNPAAVFDFPYNPRATFWIDHHKTTFFKPGLRRQYRKTKYHQFDPRYYSCCHLVLDVLRKDFDFRPPKHFRKLVKWLDVIDSARYKNAKQEIDMKEPAIQIAGFIDAARGKRKLPWLVELLSEKSLSSIVKDKRVKAVIRRAKEKKAKALVFYKKNLQIYGKVSFIDLSQSRFYQIDVAPFYLVPSLIYSVTLKRRTGTYSFSLRGNPWRRSEIKINLSDLLRKRCGGGGHRGAAGCEVKMKRRAYELAEKLVEYLRTSK